MFGHHVAVPSSQDKAFADFQRVGPGRSLPRSTRLALIGAILPARAGLV
jgi:hypothetical protein